jgi:phosphatidylglycerophosphate synthase
MIAGWKDRIERALYPFASRLPIPPNFITLLSAAAAIAAGYFAAMTEPVYAAVLLAVSAFLDVLDGTVAKSQGRASARGAFYDRVADRISDFAILSGIFLGGYIDGTLFLAAVFFVYTASYESSVLESLLKAPVGEKMSWRSIRLLVLFFGLLLQQPYYATIAVLAIGVVSFFERLAQARKLP